MRLQKFLSRAGIASRRAAEILIRSGRVSVNRRAVSEMGTTVAPSRDAVKVDGRLVRLPETHRYFILNKPREVVSTLADPQGRATVRDFLPAPASGLFPVGRLDWDAEGLLIFTDDGDLAHRLAHPRHRVERTYHVKVRGEIGEKALRRLRSGLRLEDGRAQAEEVRQLRTARTNSWISLTLREGRHHEVKRLCLAVGHPVQKLRRVSHAGQKLGTLQPGECRSLTTSEVARLRRQVKG